MKLLDIFKPILTGIGVGAGFYACESGIDRYKSYKRKKDIENKYTKPYLSHISYASPYSTTPATIVKTHCIVNTHDDGSMDIWIEDKEDFHDICDALMDQYMSFNELTGCDIFDVIGIPEYPINPGEWETYRDWYYWDEFKGSWIDYSSCVINLPAPNKRRFYTCEKEDKKDE